MKPGIYQDMRMSDYLAIEALSSGTCTRILSESAMHAWTESYLNPNRANKNSKEMDIGTFAHAMLLEGGTDALVVIEADDWRTKAAKESRDAAYATGKLPILARKIEEVEAMVAAAKDYLAGCELAGIMDAGAAEQTVIGFMEGVICKGRCDWLTGDKSINLSYKTTAGTAEPESWIRTQLPGYDLATAFYERLVRTACEVNECETIYLVQEQAAPYACSLIGLSPAMRALANQKLDTALQIWGHCLKTGKFPAYPSSICYAEPKPWQLEQAEQAAQDHSVFSDTELSGGVPL